MNFPFMTSGKRYLALCSEVQAHAERCGRSPSSIHVITVTKGYPVEQITPIYEAGCRDFGENRVEEAAEKQPHFPDDVRWHFIGTLQSKKVNKVIGKYTLIHSVDEFTLAEKISHASEREGITTHILLQANTSGEESKQGLPATGWKKCFKQVLALPHIQVEGLMTMAPYTDNKGVIRDCFASLRHLRDELQELHAVPLPHLSMGMSHDYRLAIEEGATLLRIGSAICGSR